MATMRCLLLALAVAGCWSAPTTDVDLCALPDTDTQELPASCNFNNGTCGYTFPTVLWTIHTESFGGLIYGPVTGDEDGQSQTFALFQSNDARVNDTARMVSSITSTPVYSESVCLKFWYLMPNQNSKLEVYTATESGGTKSLIYEFKYQSTSRWEEVKVPINTDTPFSIIFQSEKENNYGYIGIDHVQVLIKKIITTAAPTTTTLTTKATTTTTTHPRTTSTTDMLTTTIAMMETFERVTTKGTTYARTTVAEPATTTEEFVTQRPVIRTSEISRERTVRMEKEITTTTEEPTTEPVLTTTHNGKGFTTSYIDGATTVCQCSCPPAKTVCSSDVPSTTVATVPTLCDMPEYHLSVLDQYSCDFDTDLCGFDLPIYPHLWERTSYRYGDAGVGLILGDHSDDGDGSYMVYNTYNNHVQNNTQHLLTSPELLSFAEYCVSFWYNMPTNQSMLKVYSSISGTANRTLLWSSTKSITSGWQQVRFAVTNSKNFQLEFMGWKESQLSFFALDDIRVSIESPHLNRTARDVSDQDDSTDTDCQCSCTPVLVIDCDATTTAAVTQYHSCSDLTGAVLEESVSCDFDDGTACGYAIPVYPHLWELLRYVYGNESVGIIQRDSSSKDGYGMYVAFITDNLHVPIGEKSDMVSPQFRGTGKVCLSFMYNMPTPSAKLSVYTISPGKRQVVWETSKEQTSGWKEATVVLNRNTVFQIGFSSEKTSLDGYFGLDDIRLYSHVKPNV